MSGKRCNWGIITTIVWRMMRNGTEWSRRVPWVGRKWNGLILLDWVPLTEKNTWSKVRILISRYPSSFLVLYFVMTNLNNNKEHFEYKGEEVKNEKRIWGDKLRNVPKFFPSIDMESEILPSALSSSSWASKPSVEPAGSTKFTSPERGPTEPLRQQLVFEARAVCAHIACYLPILFEF